ncbi:MAG: T9SS type A sorting domain-containing protein [Bacteroidales bacterium]|nr:T9SS type A sorting domain-containing protein [Bacteroidales bacterium]
MIYSTEYSDVRQGQVYSVNTSEFKEGIYLLNVISADSRKTRKIVVRH